jgi:hypothetical protein
MLSLPFLCLQVGGFVHLTNLWLEDNEFESFPVAICSITGLKQLRLSGNRLVDIPLSISSLKSLETLASLDEVDFVRELIVVIMMIRRSTTMRWRISLRDV